MPLMVMRKDISFVKVLSQKEVLNLLIVFQKIVPWPTN